MKRQRQRHVFDPVPSRWLGRSLGVDLVPFKTYTYDCVHCQNGRTTCRTVERKKWVLMEVVPASLPGAPACRGKPRQNPHHPLWP